jgi:LPXTG-motif cell wall-anchored protein
VSLTNPDRVTTAGTKYLAGETPVVEAQGDLSVAYDALVARTKTDTITADLGGQIIKSGVHAAGAEALALTGDLILDAEGDPDAVFIFQAGTTLTTAAGSTVVLTNQAQACNVVWQLGTSATLGTDSHIVGAIVAQVSITAMTGASIDGQLLALTGAVTLDQNPIVNDTCVKAAELPEPVPEPEPDPVTPPISPSPAPSPGETGTVDGGVLPNTGSAAWLVAVGVGITSLLLSLWAFARWKKRNQGHEQAPSS